MSVETVTRSVLRQGLTYSTFWPGALAQQDLSERRTENLLYGNTYYDVLYGTNHKSYIPEEKNKRAKNLMYNTVWHNRAQSTNQTYQCLLYL